MDMSKARSVHWEETAKREDGTEQPVIVVIWDYEAREGKAMVQGGTFVDVYITDYSLGDLTIGQKPAPKEPSMQITVFTKQAQRYLRQVNTELQKRGHSTVQADSILYGERICFKGLSQAQFCTLEDVAVRSRLAYDGTQE